jgi:urea carboxylase
LGITTLAVYVEEDADSAHVRAADELFLLQGHGSAGYLNIEEIVAICRQNAVQGVLPGYGFLSENADFAEALHAAGILFIGPEVSTLTDFGLKDRARELAIRANVPVVPGTGILEGFEQAEQAAAEMGYPVMVKATAGGGGMGLHVCHHADDLRAAVAGVQSRGRALFKIAGFFLEKFVESGRHIEAQIFGNGLGDVLFFGERECSIQRRHQKVIEEAPSPYVLAHPSLRARLEAASITLAKSVNYKSAGTIEYLVDEASGQFFFLEVNTRLQVEHGVTELCYDIDLVEMMLLQAQEEWRASSHPESGPGGLSAAALSTFARTGPKGHAVEVRIYAENPAKNYQPAPGRLQAVSFPVGDHVRVDTWIETGSVVSPHFDPLLAKVMVHSTDREAAVKEMVSTLERTKLQGPPTNLDFLIQVLLAPKFAAGSTTTDFLEAKFQYQVLALEILEPGTATMIQDWPGRVGIPNGVPPAGPMDALSFRIANLLVGNDQGTEGLEITLSGPTIKFLAPATISLCGAPFTFEIDQRPAALWARHHIAAGTEIRVGEAPVGARAYLAVRGGFPSVATYLGSKSTTPSLAWGGYQGRRLLAGDFLNIDPACSVVDGALPAAFQLDSAAIPEMGHEWRIAALPGPWFSEAYLAPEGQRHLHSTSYKVSHNSSRTGIRLDGPPPTWGREDGGEGGSHPSNMVGFGCTVGSVSFTGDSAVILPADAPNQTGFIVTHVIAGADQWKLGQLRPGDSVTLVPATWEDAMTRERNLNEFICSIQSQVTIERPDRTEGTETPEKREQVGKAILADLLNPAPSQDPGDGILSIIGADNGGRPRLILRQAGERAISCLCGPGTFDVGIRARIQRLANMIRDNPPVGFAPHSVPENCSILIYFDPKVITQAAAVDSVVAMNNALPPQGASHIPSRVIHLPAVFDAVECHETIQRYMLLQRSRAAYLPDNIDFIRRSNGLKTRDEVKNSYFGIPHLVNAVGWLMGLPIYIQVDPRHRLVVPKTNPARTFTKAGCLGTGGSTSSIYPNDSPGGYQLWGATIPGICWDTYGQRPGFSPTRPWLFEPFDQIIFDSVSRAEFDAAVGAFQAGRYQIRIEQSVFDMVEYEALLERTHDEVAKMKRTQRECTEREAALEKELFAQWQCEVGRAAEAVDLEKRARTQRARGKLSPYLLPGQLGGIHKISRAWKLTKWCKSDPSLVQVQATMIANLWKVEVSSGDIISGDKVVAILEAMKMETVVRGPSSPGRYQVEEILRETGDRVETGDILMLLKRLPEATT